MLIEITTYGFFADPVLWQISTFSPAVDAFPPGDLLPCETCEEWLTCVEALECTTTDEWLELEWLAWLLTLAWLLADAWLEWLERFEPLAFCECLVWPGVFAELPCDAWAFFSWPGAFPEFPGDEPPGTWPVPAIAPPVKTATASATATIHPRLFLGRCICSPDVE